MRWPWSPRQPASKTAPDDAEEAAAARRRAEEALAAAKEQTGEVRRVADAMRHHRRVNHFAELIGDTFRGKL